MNKINLTKKEKRFLLVEGVFFIFLIVFLFISTTPKALSPVSGMIISDNNFNFKIKNGNEVVLACDKDFVNYVTLDEDSHVTLTPGRYYWKVKGEIRESRIRSFIIQEVVGLEIDKRGDLIELKNTGTVDLNVSEKDSYPEEISSGKILGVGEVKTIENENKTYEGKNE
ncbi:MAG: hypothetical protein ACOC1K_06970 [Nanoarchaeota archaeon]